jgi:hypothetical protein
MFLSLSFATKVATYENLALVSPTSPLFAFLALSWTNRYFPKFLDNGTMQISALFLTMIYAFADGPPEAIDVNPSFT